MSRSAALADSLPAPRRLGEVLVERGLVRPADIANALFLLTNAIALVTLVVAWRRGQRHADSASEHG